MFRFLFNPGEMLDEQRTISKSLLFFLIPALAFMLFFLQTSIETGANIYFGILKGFLFGTVGIAAIASLIWLAAKIAGNTADLFNTINSIAVSYTPTVIFVLVGLVLHLAFHWNTALACGVTGVLSAFSPMSGVINKLSKGNRTMSILMMTFTGLYVLCFWVVLNNL